LIQDIYYHIGLFHSYRSVGGELAVIRGGRELAIVARVWVEVRVQPQLGNRKSGAAQTKEKTDM
jgi:hypothetical protein